MFFLTIFCLFFVFFIFLTQFSSFSVIVSLSHWPFPISSCKKQIYKRLCLSMSVSICGPVHPLVICFSKTANPSKFKWIFFYKLNTHLQHKFLYFLMSTTCVATLVDWLTISTIPTFLTILTILSLLTIPNVPTKFEVGTVRWLKLVGWLGDKEIRIIGRVG